jgi:hypothetical protein
MAADTGFVRTASQRESTSRHAVVPSRECVTAQVTGSSDGYRSISERIRGSYRGTNGRYRTDPRWTPGDGDATATVGRRFHRRTSIPPCADERSGGVVGLST